MTLSSSRLTGGTRRTRRAGTAMDKRRKSWRTTVFEDAAFRRAIRQGRVTATMSDISKSPAHPAQKTESKPFVPLAYQQSDIAPKPRRWAQSDFEALLIIIQGLQRRVSATERALFEAVSDKRNYSGIIDRIKTETAG